MSKKEELAKLRKAERKAERKADTIWSLDIRKRDNFKCVICDETNRVNAHHIYSREIKSLRWSLYNGITLCPGCHRFRKYSAHKNGFWFSLWLKFNRPAQYEWLTEAK